jgi:hypothetical protein
VFLVNAAGEHHELPGGYKRSKDGLQDTSSAENADPVHVLSIFEHFTSAIITFLTDKNSEASA